MDLAISSKDFSKRIIVKNLFYNALEKVYVQIHNGRILTYSRLFKTIRLYDGQQEILKINKVISIEELC